jgi:hypothetical protein
MDRVKVRAKVRGGVCACGLGGRFGGGHGCLWVGSVSLLRRGRGGGRRVAFWGLWWLLTDGEVEMKNREAES